MVQRNATSHLKTATTTLHLVTKTSYATEDMPLVSAAMAVLCTYNFL